MKRERDPVEEGALRDIRDAYARDPTNLALQVLSIGDIFATMLQERPQAVLRLLSVNKQLSRLLRDRPGFFMMLLGHVVRAESGNAFYAFYVCEFHTGHLKDLIAWIRKRGRTGQVSWVALVYGVLHYNIDLHSVGKPARYELRSPPLVRGDQATTYHQGQGDDIVLSARKIDPLYTSMIEIARYSRRLPPLSFTEVNNAIPAVVWPTAWEPTGELRAKMCRLHCFLAPCSLDYFQLLDTRRLHFNRILTTMVSECITFGMKDPLVPFLLQQDDDKLRTYKYNKVVTQLNRMGRDPNLTPEQFEAYLDQVAGAVDMDKAAQRTFAYLEALLAKAWSHGFSLSHTREQVFAQTLALLGQPLPEACIFLEIGDYRAQLRTLYKEVPLAKRALQGELRYLDQSIGKRYTTRHYGACVQCHGETETVDLASMTFMCETCYDGE